MAIIPLAILNGGLREYVLTGCRKSDYVSFGIIRFILINAFDLMAYLRDGSGFSGLLHSYDFRTGNTWILLVLTTVGGAIPCC
ncbi:MAG: hypothetical protein IJ721_01690 [Bacteroidales bacterium]|nr:hypothetical protein [Bacteroidales bacterium]